MKISPKILHWCKHYFYGLLAQSFNGAMTGIFALGIMGEQGKLPEGVTFHVLAHTFAVSFGLHILLYFKSNPLPSQLPEDSIPSITVAQQPDTSK